MNKEFVVRALRGLNRWYEPLYAASSGVVRGDDQAIDGGKGGIRYACCRCGIMVETSYVDLLAELRARGARDKTVPDLVTAKGWVPSMELIVREAFVRKANEAGCAHFLTRLGYPDGTSAQVVLGDLAARLVKVGGHASG